MSNDAIGGRILNIGHVYKLQTWRDEPLHVWILNIGRMKMSNDAIGGWILNIGHVYKLQTQRDKQLHVWIMNIGRMKMSNEAKRRLVPGVQENESTNRAAARARARMTYAIRHTVDATIIHGKTIMFERASIPDCNSLVCYHKNMSEIPSIHHVHWGELWIILMMLANL